MDKPTKSHLIHFSLPVPEGFTGQILVNVEKALPLMDSH